MTGMKKQVAFLLVGLMILGGPWAMFAPPGSSCRILGIEPNGRLVARILLMFRLISFLGVLVHLRNLMLPNNDATITNLNLSLSSKAITTSQSFIWDDASAWDHPDA